MTYGRDGPRTPVFDGIHSLLPPLRETRFWLIQILVATIATLHAAVEWASDQDRLMGFLDGIQDLPVPASIVPLLLAGIWYGLRGGILTATAMVLIAVPNLVLFHGERFAWLGEASTILVVITVALVVASVVERNFDLRRRAEANEERLRTLWDLGSALARCESDTDMVAAAVGELGRGREPTSVSFEWDRTDHPADGHVDAGLDRTERGTDPSGTGLDGEQEQESTQRSVFDVATPRQRFGRLVVDCFGGSLCFDDSRLFSLAANDLASSLGRLANREAERSHLRAYARAVTTAQESERKRIARDLHDGPVQSMIVMNRALAHLDEPDGEKRVAQLRELVHETLGSLQQTSQALRPLVLDDLGLVAATRSLAARRSRRASIPIHVDVVGDARRLDPEIEVVAYRIAQEALTNVERHAESDRAEVVLDFSREGFSMSIRDDGRGMESVDEAAEERFGIVGMRERAELVGGELRIESSPGEGTTVALLVR